MFVLFYLANGKKQLSEKSIFSVFRTVSSLLFSARVQFSHGSFRTFNDEIKIR